MSITLNLPPQIEAAFDSEAAKNGIPVEDVAMRLIQDGVQAKPVAERELTAFTALDGEPFYDCERCRPRFHSPPQPPIAKLPALRC